MNVKKLRAFLALYERYMEVRPRAERARITAERNGRAPMAVPEVAALLNEVEALRNEARARFGVSPIYFGLLGREVKRLVESNY